ncbi:cyanocobalamin reductase / alkylcobalamin dealkylase-like [Mytilus californianus]|uniref:cyanocobalamin reductase / alkylcobalamin dealkylase-like n=1 Tax=Mytilus californianus TaxID=6549 RepID=UPI002246826B|nr:cyanocobalamin reductase / alkylcobalamin dealkylase-like [Mytilus californianus]
MTGKNKIMDISELSKLTESISNELDCTGFEVKPFKIGWYNDKVDKRFILPETYDTIGYLIISTPSMFENAFLPFICRQECTGVKDPLDQCVAHYFQQIKQKFPDYNIESIHDYELHPNHRPKVLVQTVAHVSGAAYFYQRSDVSEDPWDTKKKMCGVCIHPQYGGWFALRGVLIFKNIECPSLIQENPIDVIPTCEKRIELLERFNYSWQDWTYRDLTETVEKYSDDQKQYFATPPKDRKELILSLKNKIKLQSEEIRGS